ncbi:TetR/AcrR family transcriptional regulator [Paraglaciecola aquimarina]|uniref:TetR/AcrR family transcriptional regulator n=1 Tax=Paraglaciecola algarum TaxID=3050085 RepID=A0ABS9D3P5_9ALTE|nr:TetR/AcrR family transcriptional regulator [Paraglaciecola sp. G1-23]
MAVTRRIPKQKRSIEKVERILDAAALLMKEVGADNITTHLVAKRAEIAVGSLYQFFPNIDTVKIALIERVMKQLYLTIMQTLQSDPVFELAELSARLIDATLNFYCHKQSVVQTILAIRNTEAFEQVKAAKNEKVITGIVSYISSNNQNIDVSQLTRKTRIAIMVSDVMTFLVWTAPTEKERLAYINEWKLLSTSYAMTIHQ